MGMALLNDIERKLRVEYESILANVDPPDWAYQYAPAIPFVGNGYGAGNRSKVLVYSSAENLTYTRALKEVPLWMQPENQIIRSRIEHYERGGTCVHIQPIDNGSLLKAARHSLTQVALKGSFSIDSPQAFLDQIAVANPGKFSVDAKRNEDYAGVGTPWHASAPFIAVDIRVLDPDIIIIPKTILNTLRSEPLELELLKAGRTIIPNYQITAGTINRLIKRQLRNSSVPRKRSIVDDWPLAPGWQKLDMSPYLHWLDAIAINWIETRP